jgi:hypothetical protein
MSELSPLSGVKLKSDFGAVRADFDPNATMRSTQEWPTASAIGYQRLMIHFAPANISQTATVATVSTMMVASKAIERRAPSSSR